MEESKQSSTVKKKNRQDFLLILLCSLIYFTSYVTRKTCQTAQQNIVENTAITSETMGIVLAALMFSYGFGQIISGILGDKFRPQHLILCGLLITICCNCVFPFLGDNTVLLSIVWAINGFAQAMFWPPMVRIITQKLSPERTLTAMFWVMTASHIATVAIYLIVPMIISISSWQFVFFSAAVFAVIVTGVWLAYCISMRKSENVELLTDKGENKQSVDVTEQTDKIETNESKPHHDSLGKILIISGVLIILAAIALQGFLRDGIETWMPTYLSSVFGLDSEVSILMSVILPLVSILGSYLYTELFKRVLKNEVLGSLIFFGTAALLLLVLWQFYAANAVLSLILAALSSSLMHGVNMMLISYLPTRFTYTGKVSTISGITNACTYVGSTVAMFLNPIIATAFGWRGALLVWLIIALVGVVVCVITLKRWTTFVKQNAEISSNNSETKPEETVKESTEE